MDVSIVIPSSERISARTSGSVMCGLMISRKMELRYWWKCVDVKFMKIVSNKKVSFSGSKIYVEIRAFDSLSESLSSEVERFVT